MDVLRIVVKAGCKGGSPSVEAVVHINDRSLIDLAREVELPFAERDGTPSLAGEYAGLPPRIVAGPGGPLLGQTEPGYFEDGRVTLLECTCGTPGCWPLIAWLALDESTVTWSGFAQPHRREWDLSALGPFVFDRVQYESALAAVGGR